MPALNHNLQKLTGIAQKEARLGIGLMSGTSLDGLDIALCKFKGSGTQTAFELLNFITIPYQEKFKYEVQQVFAKKEVSLEKVTLLNAYLGTFHGELVLQALNEWGINPGQVDFIASHGQTIYHAPGHQHKQPGYGNATLQIGDGDHLAVTTGILTISDFRQKHIAAGGEGAPLALYGDVLLGSKPGEHRILLNIGGIANLTYLPADAVTEVLCTDIGPGNTLIDAACRRYFNQPYDADSQIANTGEVNQVLLDALLDHPFFREALPKTTGPELFNLEYVADAQQAVRLFNINKTDLVATLSAFTGRTISNFIRTHFNLPGLKIFVSGGGARNPYIINYLKSTLPNAAIADTSTLGINPDAKEAILFALLGNEALCGEPMAIGKNPAVLMGKFSFAG
ncbi:anhydro-N-acetylmuramic acid kinase [Mucilaginibacter phyllosphaerae]|uniref:Anhydro-N-acetylmuramic acid kinase n=1 Tax=Mucilaginibacter phyllosphaerae TaxID=1812349 RepID=A0A4Y8ADL5_9SPHI|nr:anhydro-N-acetylmuramic acid kinase [Mucilaginibacter phyllosphaerae]MBB3970366.1 anhydro-N-acetylmuramic acid kinase [Mucilaginibacter phyllosphaerae]TEW66734.1 anhydro-N-acetylmuramic acid kinase [Mucilaginibacter phyllosphaerae]GGH11564.1 anhydro-N-acetylmuramic acid kinase [Mucilaginibacter phyllosphaerae]